jgi:hypothetical protein
MGLSVEFLLILVARLSIMYLKYWLGEPGLRETFPLEDQKIPAGLPSKARGAHYGLNSSKKKSKFASKRRAECEKSSDEQCRKPKSAKGYILHGKPLIRS